MNAHYTWCEAIDLLVSGRISPADAARQRRTAQAILQRFAEQPGVILADEVGMGKTFVALAVAVSVGLASGQPVVVMVPSSLHRKWPKDMAVFLQHCVPPEVASRVRHASAARPVEFLKLLDDPPERRNTVVFVTHGAMSMGLQDPWTRLALIQRALRYRRDTADLKSALCRFLPKLLRVESRIGSNEALWSALMDTPAARWRDVFVRYGVPPEQGAEETATDDPVPAAVLFALESLPTDELFEALSSIPRRETDTFNERMNATRAFVTRVMKDLWQDILSNLRLQLPLLILDEAHHLKNAETQLASLFRTPEAEADAALMRGALSGAFERMLFLTATPFQLGHDELCSVLDRFKGIAWHSAGAPRMTQDAYSATLDQLRNALDDAQRSALRLEAAWGRLRASELGFDTSNETALEDWWAGRAEHAQPLVQDVAVLYGDAEAKMRLANEALIPWVIRHLRNRTLEPGPGLAAVMRRMRLVGGQITNGDGTRPARGLDIPGDALLPFLLAARATTVAPDQRATYAEGLASSYEAFLHTGGRNAALATDGDDDPVVLDTTRPEHARQQAATRWYLARLRTLVEKEIERSAAHPKLDATVARVLDLWRAQEKVVVFCHFIETGKALRRRISAAIADDIAVTAARKLDMSRADAERELELIGNRFFDSDSPLRRAVDMELLNVMKPIRGKFQGDVRVLEIMRRYVRTPSFLVRYLLPDGGIPARIDAPHARKLMQDAMARADGSGVTLRQLLDRFCRWLAERCTQEERDLYIGALDSVQTGSHRGAAAAASFHADELGGESADRLIANVRLVNGSTQQETRQTLMLTFNTPFFPEVLVTSNVLAEGVDLHLNCRHIIHHDLCWNPSTLEQRTGRVDRIGAKCEQAGRPVEVNLPYIAETQDQKMYQVVTDRERWFNVVMGEKFSTDPRSTERIAERVPLPVSAVEGLSFRLGVADSS